ncbi:MAG: helix-turn-helix domain-containing protein [Candidatus Hydrogenedentota bacterium]
MTQVWLHISDPADRMTLKVLLERGGHSVSDAGGEVVITDTAARAIELASRLPTLVLCAYEGVGEAVDAMRKGVYGYILRPFQPGEATIKVDRALDSARQSAPRPAVADPPPGYAVPPAETPATTAHTALPSLAQVEREHIERVLRSCHFNHTQTARTLGIGRNTLWRKLKRYRMEDNAPD